MVLGLSIRKKKQSTELPKPVRTPSLPDIRAQSLVWPESLVDFPLYHRPTPAQDAPIASKYAAPPSSYPRGTSAPGRRSSVGSRRTRAPAPFNLMVAGPQGVGKSALLRLLLQMSDPPAQFDLSSRPTKTLATSTVELHGAERVLLTIIDTPGLDYSTGAELELEKSVTALVKHIDNQYAETLGEESKVVRQSKGDRHVHLCIYLIDPSSVQSQSQRARASRSHSALPRSETPDSSSHDSDDDSDSEDDVGLAPSEIRAIQRIGRRTNILPVIAKGDTLTDARLEKVRKAVRRDLIRAGVDMRIFGVSEDDSVPERGRTDSRVTLMQGQDDAERKVIKIRSTRRPSRARSTQRPEEDVPPELPPKPTGLGLDTGAGTSSVSLPTATPDVHFIPHADDPTLARMFPLVVIAPDTSKSKRPTKPKAPVLSVSPEPEAPGTPTAITTDSPDLPSAELGASGSVNGHGGGKIMSPISSSRSPSAYPSAVLPPSSWRPSFGNGPRQYVEENKPEGRTYPRGVFTRKYRWGTIDVLDPAHCDVGVLRSVVLGSHMNVLKTHTREVLYEKFRTEKLLARRATQNITPEQRSRLMKGLDP